MWELLTLEAFEELHAVFAHKFGHSPAYISHWDPLDDEACAIAKQLHVPPTIDPVRYLYPNDGDGPSMVQSCLGYPTSRKVIITPSSTSSTVVTLTLAARLGIRRIILVQPFYFATLRVVEILDLQPRLWPAQRGSNGFWLEPLDQHSIGPETAVWITDPLYCTGHSLLDRSREVLDDCLEQGALIILDQSLSNPTVSETAGSLVDHDRCWVVGSPHKGICVNGVKFSYLSVPVDLVDIGRHFSDVLCGGASSSNVLAVEQFVRGDVSRAWHAILPLLTQRKAWLSSQVDQCDAIEIDTATSGHFVSCYFQGLSADREQSERLVADVLDKTGMLVIPGNRAYFAETLGFNFRVNLLRLDSGAEGRLHHALEYLSCRR